MDDDQQVCSKCRKTFKQEDPPLKTCPQCRRKTRKRVSDYRAENAEKCRRQARGLYAKNRDKILKLNSDYRAENAEKCRRQHARYYIKNRERRLDRRRSRLIEIRLSQTMNIANELKLNKEDERWPRD